MKYRLIISLLHDCKIFRLEKVGTIHVRINDI